MSDKAESGFSIHALLLGLFFGSFGVFGIFYGSGNWSAPELASNHGAGIDAMMKYLLVCVGGLFLAGHLFLAFMVIKSGATNRVTMRMASPRAEKMASVILGVVFALIAEGGVVAIGVPVWDEYYRTEVPEDAVTVTVVAQQFVWNFHYPGPDGEFGRTDPSLIDDVINPIGLDRSDPAAVDDFVSINQLVLPVDELVNLKMTSKDVIHSLFLPHLRVKQDDGSLHPAHSAAGLRRELRRQPVQGSPGRNESVARHDA